MKSCTDLDQSIKLAEFLPIESADMYWWATSKRYYIEAIDDGDFNEAEGHLRAWSLSALLDILPKRIGSDSVLRMDYSEEDFSIWYDEIGCGVNNDLPDITMESPIDACVELIIELHELKVL